MAMTRISLFNYALTETGKLREQFPNDSAIRSIVDQLEFLIELEQGEWNDSARLDDIIIGILIVREIEPLNVEVADLLYKVVDEVEQMKQQHKSST